MTAEANVERLETVTDLLEWVEIYSSENHSDALEITLDKLIDGEHINWIIHQAERVQEFENLYDEQLEESQKTYSYFKLENDRLRKAIKQSLEVHKWNNEESAQILEKAIEGESE